MNAARIRAIACGCEDCPTCGAVPGQPCAGTTGTHLCRVACAAAEGRITSGDLGSVIPDADEYSGSMIVLAGAR